MNVVHRFSRSTLPAIAWKNGGGSTCEIVGWPPAAGIEDFDWRVSIATIAASGPFSRFEGVDRTIMLLAGDGVRLKTADGRIDHMLDQPYAPVGFDGGETIDCTLLGTTSTDFNVMSRRTRGMAQMRVIDAADTWAGATHGLLMATAGCWRAGDVLLIEGDGLWWAQAAQDWLLAPEGSDARLLAVRWTPINEPRTT